MNCSERKITKNFLIFLVLISVLFSGCGVTVTKVENTTSEPQTEITEKIFSTTLQSKDKTTATDPTTATTAKDKTEKKTTKASKKKSSSSTVTTTKKQAKKVTCTIEIDCKTILDNIENLRPEKKAFLPSDGYILHETTVSVNEGITAFDVLKLVCKQNTCPEKCTYCRQSGIQLEYVYTPGYDSEYVRGIHQLYEKDCGTQSGWMYSVNGVFPNYGCNKYTVKNGDKIKFRFTCDLGEDVGDSFG